MGADGVLSEEFFQITMSNAAISAVEDKIILMLDFTNLLDCWELGLWD